MKWLVLLLFALHCSAAGAQLYYPPATGNTWETTDPLTLGWCQESLDSLYAYLEKTNTKGFIVLKNGRIAIEKYFGAFTRDSLWVWNSAGKTLTAFAIGIAQRDGYLDVDDPTSDYLGPYWTALPPELEEKITLRHQLTMTTGLDDGVADDFCTDAVCLQYKADPGTRWAYHNAPYTLLDTVIESATGLALNDWVSRKIKSPTGMTGAFYKVDSNHIYISNVRSMARFGLLLQSGGYWGTAKVLSDDVFFAEMTRPSQPMNPAYGFLTWLNGQRSFMIPGSEFVYAGWMLPRAPVDVIAADGKDGQLINVSPATGLVLVRMGNGMGNSKVPNLYNDTIWTYMNRLTGRACKKGETGDGEESAE